MIYHLTHYKTVQNYAKMCGVNTYTIADRVKHKRVFLTVIGKKKFVNVAQNRPTHFFKEEDRLTPEERTIRQSKYPEVAEGLIAVKEFAAKHKMRADKIYELIIADKIDAWQIENISFVSNTDCLALIKGKKP